MSTNDTVQHPNITHTGYDGVDQISLSSNEKFPTANSDDDINTDAHTTNINISTSRLRNRTSRIEYKENDDHEEGYTSDSEDDFPESQDQDTQKSPNTTRNNNTTTLESSNLTAQDTCKPTIPRNRKSNTISRLGLDHFDSSCISDKDAKLRTEMPFNGIKH